MKRISVLLLSLLISSAALSKVLVVSDLDDTIKIAGIGSKTLVAANYAAGVRPFKHLINIYHDIKKSYLSRGEEVEFVYLTSAPAILNSAGWLREHGAPRGRLIERTTAQAINPFGGPSSDYKIKALTSVIKKGDYSEILLFGDNGEYDPIVYKTVVDNLGVGAKTSIFIRDVTARATVCEEGQEGVFYFLSEADLLSTDLRNHITERVVELIDDDYAAGVIYPIFVAYRYTKNRMNNCK